MQVTWQIARPWFFSFAALLAGVVAGAVSTLLVSGLARVVPSAASHLAYAQILLFWVLTFSGFFAAIMIVSPASLDPRVQPEETPPALPFEQATPKHISEALKDLRKTYVFVRKDVFKSYLAALVVILAVAGLGTIEAARDASRDAAREAARNGVKELLDKEVAKNATDQISELLKQALADAKSISTANQIVTNHELNEMIISLSDAVHEAAAELGENYAGYRKSPEQVVMGMRNTKKADEAASKVYGQATKMKKTATAPTTRAAGR